MKSLYLSFPLALLLLSGCANREGVAPSQNSSLHAVSPSTTATSEGGAMQRSLDAWLKEEWASMSQPSVQTTKAADGKVTTSTTSVAESVDDTSFTLQKYADKWKVYHENKEKMNAGKPEEPSHVDSLKSMPVIGK